MLNEKLIVPESEVKVRKFNESDGLIGMMDCSGSTLVALNKTWPGIVKMIVSSRPDGEECKAEARAKELNVPYAMFDAIGFEKEKPIDSINYFKALKIIEYVKSNRGKIPLDKKIFNKKNYLLAKEAVDRRNEACKFLMEEIYTVMEENNINKNIPALGAGFMLLTSQEMNKKIYTLTNHPGDLTLNHIVGKHERGGRSIVGDGHIPALRAIQARQPILYSSIFRTGDAMDNGSVIMRGHPLESCVDYIDAKIDMKNADARIEVATAAQNALKYLGDQQIGPAAFYDLFKGNIGRHKSGILTYKMKDKWYIVPSGITIEIHQVNNPNSKFGLYGKDITMHNENYRKTLETIAEKYPLK